jgi:hypothetical protein
VRYERDDTFVAVFHGRASFELGVEFGRRIRVDDQIVDQKFHIREVLALLVPEVTFAARTATSVAQVARFLDELAGWTELAAERFPSDVVGTFDQLQERGKRWSDEYLEGIRASRLRTQGDEAWRGKDFASVVTAYEEIESELHTVQLRESEAGRLGYARKKLADT